jgi:hypothetical protein
MTNSVQKQFLEKSGRGMLRTEFIFGGSCLILLVLFRTWGYITGLDEP